MDARKQILDLVDKKLNDSNWLSDPKNIEIREIMQEEDFYLQKGQDAYKAFMNYKVDEEELKNAYVKIKRIKKPEEVRKVLYDPKYSFNKQDKFEKKIETLISYLDDTAYRRTKYNKYSPYRYVANTQVRQPDWSKQLVNHKLGSDRFSYVAGGAIEYLRGPYTCLSILTEDAQGRIAYWLLGKEYDPSTFAGEVMETFSDYRDRVQDASNFSIFCSRLLWEKDIKEIWDRERPPDPIESKHPLNQILYGPPGTGKTYRTKELAVRIVAEQQVIEDIDNAPSEDERRKIINKEYNKHLSNRIQIVTFHQSYGYEEFVEGIKPKIDSATGNSIEYEIKPGMFKKICMAADPTLDDSPDKNIKEVEENLDASKNKLNAKDFVGKTVWGTSIGIDGKEEERLNYKKECLSNNFVALPLRRTSSRVGDLSKLGGGKNTTKRSYFYDHMNEGDLVIITVDGKSIDAVGILGKYKYRGERELYKHTRDVQWLWRCGEGEKGITKLDIYQDNPDERDRILKPTELQAKELLVHLEENNMLSPREDGDSIKLAEGDVVKNNNYVLIIDEINRGNISKILGELITLIEKDKRKDAEEELTVALPYSGEPFSVPSNLYIIGTMNTADRSIAFLDAALRRRFEFKEIMPKPELLRNIHIGKIDLMKLLTQMNMKIIEYLDRDHQIGHSYFMKLRDAATIEELAKVFRNNICPLLDEYFYDQRGKIAEVLGGDSLFIVSGNSGEWRDNSAFEVEQSYKDIYEKGV